MSGVANESVERALEQAGGVMTAEDLGELMRSFNEVTARLQATHRTLQDEVARLHGELGRANAALERSRRLAALGEMAAGIAHEVRNPLGSIRLYATILEEDLSDRPEERDVARKIGAAVRGLDAVVGDVLSFAREARVRPIDVDAADLIERSISTAGVHAVVRVDKGLSVVCDPDLVHQALVNVLRNAGDAMHEAGSEAGAVAYAETRGEWFALGVRDSGPGIPDDAIERMFNPFFTTRATGTGLGLAIVNRIVDAHGGRVEVFNNSTRERDATGATVELVLPREPIDAADAAEIKPMELEHHG